MALSQSSFLNLSWRSKDITHRDLAAGLELVANQFDQDGRLDIQYTATTDTRVVAMQDAAGATPAMYRTSGKLMNRSLPSSRDSKETPSQRRAGQSLYLACEIRRRVDSKVSWSKRRFFYETGLQSRGVSEDSLYEMCIDLAITLKVHPYRLGMKAERKSQVFVPEGCTLKLDTTEDIFKYNDGGRDATKVRYFLGGNEYLIPGMIEKLSVEIDGQRIRAVVVTEHRNIKDVLLNMQGNDAWRDLRGVIVVMTAGFPDWAVREFLCLLSKTDVTEDIPYLWLSDGDSHGIAKYLQCKYGSRATAFAAPSMVCPRLLFGGMQQSTLDDFVDKYPERTLGRRVKQTPDLTEEEQATILSDASLVAAQKKQHIMSRRLHGPKKKAQQNRLKGIRNAGYLLNGREPEVEVIVKSLENEGPVLAMSCVSSFDAHAMLFMVRDAVLSVLNEKPEEVPFVAQNDSLREAFVQAGDLAHGQSSQHEVVAEAEEEFDEDEVIEEYTHQAFSGAR